MTDPDELVHLLIALMEDATDAIAVERAMAGTAQPTHAYGITGCQCAIMPSGD